MSIHPDQINQAAVVDEVHAAFQAYEAALMRNDVHALNDFFWADERVTRYGMADQQYGHGELVAYRQGVSAPDFSRQLEKVRISTFGQDMAVAMTEFVRSDTPLRGFQTQTWVRMEGRWRIVSAHVSMRPVSA